MAERSTDQSVPQSMQRNRSKAIRWMRTCRGDDGVGTAFLSAGARWAEETATTVEVAVAAIDDLELAVHRPPVVRRGRPVEHLAPTGHLQARSPQMGHGALDDAGQVGSVGALGVDVDDRQGLAVLIGSAVVADEEPPWSALSAPPPDR